MMRRLTVCICALLVSGVLPCVQAQEQRSANDQKVIRDPVEYNAYTEALNTQDPSQRAAAMEAFVAGYPNSVVREDALERALAAYQQAGKMAEVEQSAGRILELDPDNVRALAIIVALTRVKLSQRQKDVKLAGLHTLAQRGLRAVEHWEEPAGMTPSDFEKLQKQMKAIFYGAAGFAALQEKDYAVASHNYSKALEVDPDDMVNTYQLSIACLEMANPDVRGFWYLARAIHMAEKQHSAAAVGAMAPYGQAKYRKYHGSLEGWDEVFSRAANTTAPPRDFTVERAPAASLTSDSSPGSSHSTPASALSANTTSAGIASPARGASRGVAASVLSSSTTPAGIAAAQQSPNVMSAGNGVAASVLSSNSPGTAHRVPASVLSSNSPGVGRAVPASITSSTAGSSMHLVRFGRAHHPPVPIPIFVPAYR